uniref:Uncharacterized protein n=1 Tax=Arundo donax TaxID=35708 RepID=A0A0A9BZC9_ARUDO
MLGKKTSGPPPPREEGASRP